MTANFYGAMCAWTVCFLVTCAVSAVTRPKPAAELAGLVHHAASDASPAGFAARRRAWIFAALVLAALIVLNWIFY